MEETTIGAPGFQIDDVAEQQRLIQQLRNLHVKLRPVSRVLLHDPFAQWDLFFIASIWFDDPSLDFILQREAKLPPSEFEKMDYVFDWVDNRLVLVRSPL